ncbi:hypothetical protein HKX48_009247 [Thoreauomyces humboldtii]|nr:hypothetical protein HKX48_009247 [Thoreauomyces humboldtii]
MSGSDLLELWKAHKASLAHPSSAAASLAATHFAPDASIVYVPTAAGADGLPAIQLFLRTFVEQFSSVVTEEKLINRVVSENGIAEEVIVTLVHDATVDWLLPDVKPTNRRILLPMTVFVTFNLSGQISAKRVHWDQGTVMKQIGLLPASLFCKSNNSETIPPVLGPRIVDRLLHAHTKAVQMEKEHWDAAPVAGVLSGKAHHDSVATRAMNHSGPAHGILPQGDADEDLRVAQARRDQRAAHAHPVGNSFDEQPVPGKRPGSAVPGQNGDMSSILHNSEPSATAARSSTRIHHAQASKTSDIFGADASAEQHHSALPVDPRRFHSSISFGNVAPAAEDVAPAATGLRRDPNWSHAKDVAEPAEIPYVSGKKIFTPAELAAVHADNHEAPRSKKHYEGALNNASQFSLRPDEVVEDGVPAAGAAGVHHGRKHSAMAQKDNDIFGYNLPQQGRPRSGKRDPNARSDEVVAVRPSSRVLQPPGGGQSFSFA